MIKSYYYNWDERFPGLVRRIRVRGKRVYFSLREEWLLQLDAKKRGKRTR